MGIGGFLSRRHYAVGWRPNLAAWTIVDLREFLPDEAVPPIEMGDGAAPVP